MDFLTEAYRQVRGNKGAPGVDNMTFDDIEARGVEDFLKDIQESLYRKSYKPSPVLRVYIPKPNGEKRPLGIPTIRDRVVQASFKLVLEPIFEADFARSSFGYRVKKSAHDAIREILKYLNWGCQQVYDVDLSKYFDTVGHGKLMKLIARRIVDSNILRVIKQWLCCGYVEDGRHHTPKRGTPQGGVISPLLANIYLNPMNRAMDRSGLKKKRNGSVHIISYADDFVVLANRNLDAGKRIVHHYLNRLELKINHAKTREYSISDKGTLEFLGFRFVRAVNFRKGNKFFLVMPSRKALLSVMAKLRHCINHLHPVSIKEQIKKANSVIRGWVNYYGLGNASSIFNKLRWHVNRRVRRVLQRWHKRRGHGYNRITSDLLYGKLGLFCDYKVMPL
jgi:group II intron reverse transcriptase/maturase